MRLSDYTDYACRVLMHCASHPDELITVAGLAERYGISKNHLMKIVQHLGQHGMLQTTRGRGGGVRLGVDPAQLRLGDVVRVTEPDFKLVECFDPASNSCRLTPQCSLRHTMNAALQAFLHELDRVTLADLVQSASKNVGTERRVQHVAMGLPLGRRGGAVLRVGGRPSAA
ncbi:RrF2 family transcriptional regulator [Ottowia testudinis]|uniref:Rrf2 family transcriptional regulator n=1 Tax=Ottowia testudinis TaxID=2816950 RepID=A0A975CHR8_9BURK|nr:Rrf2 family transcriptional regulator [Ottowia testudinis]QTD46595.1 Rrf2 family transcriptional regulator [Ottowia testudinis]